MELQNLRLFGQVGPLRLAPLTFVFGKNSSGKTTLLRAPLLFRQALMEQSATGETALSGPDVDFGTYRDLVRDGDRRRDVVLKFDFSARSRGNRSSPAAFGEFVSDSLSAELTIHWNKRNGQAQIQSLVFVGDNRVTVSIVREGPNAVRLTVPTLDYSEVLPGVPEISLRTLDFLLFRRIEPDRKERDATLLLYGMSNVVQQAVRSLSYIPPIREMPDRVYRIDRAAPSGSIGSEMISVVTRNRAALQFVAASLRRLEIAEDIQTAKAAPGFINLMLTTPDSKQKVNLADVGFGASQVLPILVTLFTAIAGSSILIEQPELHLHPQAQVALADVLIDAVVDRRLQLTLESHSEHMFLRVRRRIAEGRIPRDAVAVYVVDRGIVSEVVIDQAGRIDKDVFPPGFFEEEWTEALALARAGSKHVAG
jgi:hypothetical protein